MHWVEPPLASSIVMFRPRPSFEQTPPPGPPALLMSVGQPAVAAVLATFWIWRANTPGRLPAGLVSVMVPSAYWPGSMPAAATLDVLMTVLQAEARAAVQSLAPLMSAAAAPVMFGPVDRAVPAATSVIVRTPAAKVLPGFVVVAVNVAKVPTLTSELITPTPITVKHARLNKLSFNSVTPNARAHLGILP